MLLAEKEVRMSCEQMTTEASLLDLSQTLYRRFVFRRQIFILRLALGLRLKWRGPAGLNFALSCWSTLGFLACCWSALTLEFKAAHLSLAPPALAHYFTGYLFILLLYWPSG